MKVFSIFIAAIFTMQAFASTKMICAETTTAEPPFYISDATDMGKQNFENFRSSINLYQVQSSIPKKSIVRVLDGEKARAKANSKYVGVEVLSVPDQPGKAAKAWTKEGDQGFIYYDSLVRPSKAVQQQVSKSKYDDPKKNADYIFQVNQDVPFLLAGDLQLKRGQYLKLATVTDTNGVSRFKARECCEAKENGVDKQKCKLEYFFALLNEDKKEVLKEFYFDPNEDECKNNVLSHLSPIQVDDLKKVISIVDQQADLFRPTSIVMSPEALANANTKPVTYMAPAKITDAKGTDLGFSKIMLIKPIDSKFGGYDWYEGPFGSIHYNIRPDNKARTQTSGKKDAICAFTHVMKEQQAACTTPGCKVIFGDFYSPTSEGIHASHHTGRCVDVLPMRPNNDNPTAVWNRDTKKTSDFRTRVASYGGTVLDHGSHLHVCFPEPSKFVYSKMRDCLDNPGQYEKVQDSKMADNNGQ